MKRWLVVLILFFIIVFQINTSIAVEEELIEKQVEELQINKLINDIEEVTDENINLKMVFQNSLKGESSGNILIKAIGTILGEQLRICFKIMVSILLIIIIYGVLKTISENLGNDQTGKIGHFVQIIILITLLLKVYADILQIARETIDTISNFVYMLLIPVVIIATTIGIISNISDEMHMKKLSKYMKSAVIWVLCILLTIFTCILNMESSLGKGVDELTSKTTKTAVSTFVPVVGKILGDTVESVLGCTNVIKNAVGTLGIVAVVAISAVPLIRIGITCMFLYLISGLAEVVADEKIVYVLEQMGDSCKVLFASVASVVVMLIIGFTITMRIGIPT